MMNKQQTNDDTEFLFNVDLMITGKSNAVALQKLLDILNNQQELADFRIVTGIKLGTKIEQTLDATSVQRIPLKIPVSVTTKRSSIVQTRTKTETKPKVASSPSTSQQSSNSDMGNWLSMYIENSHLIRLTINRRGERMSIPCRVLKYDNDDQTISVYHVDEKQVYTFKLNEIDDFQQA
ncbi:hypothetical protein [Paenibacillus campi]|uniref:hypothetical protein n=1 Tax=Paenibacillus campi TaxID=3106031 RepID=UPI002AFED5A8|nr:MULTISPECIES: hypothetical protein [unclassified Paenibacillus]